MAKKKDQKEWIVFDRAAKVKMLEKQLQQGELEAGDREKKAQELSRLKDQHILSKDQAWHMIRRGILVQIHFDLETFGLEKNFAQIASYGDAIGDIAGNFISSAEIHVKRPDRYLPSIESLAVTRTSIDELDDESRDPHRVAMGKIASRFENASSMIEKLPHNRITVEFDTVRRKGDREITKHFEEEVLEFPLLDEKGGTVSDVRYHPARNRIAYRVSSNPASRYYESVENNFYREDDGSKWKFVDPSVLVSGYRIKWADIPWLRANLVKAGFHPGNVFFTHSRATITNKQKAKNYAVDAYSVALKASLFGPQGEEGIKISERTDQRTGERVASAQLSRVMETNTRYMNKQRGIREGVRMPDGSHYDKERAHRSPAYDAQASFALYNYARRIAPDVVQDLEIQSDEKDLRRILPGENRIDRDPPIHALLRNDYPYAPVADPVAFLGFDDQLGQMRRAIMMRLDGNLRTFSWRGKKLTDMAAEDLIQMIKAQGRNSDALINPVPLRKWPGSITFEKALHSGVGQNWDVDQVIDNFQFLTENEDLCQTIREAVEVINWEIHNRPEPANPVMEEQWTTNGFGDLDYYQNQVDFERLRYGKAKQLPDHGVVPTVTELVYNKALDIYNNRNTLDELLHRLALQPHPVDFSDDPDAIANFKDMARRIRTRLSEKGSPYVKLIEKWPLFNAKDLTGDQARAFRWGLMKKFLDHDERQRQDRRSHFREGIFDRGAEKKGRVLFGNLSRDFRVVDSSGRELTGDYLKKQFAADPKNVIKNFERNQWRIEFYRLSSEPSITATLFQFADSNRLDDLDQVWQQRYEGLKRLYLNGPPNEDPSKLRWQAIPNNEQRIKQIEVNTRTNKRGAISRVFSNTVSGDAEVFVRSDEGQRILSTYRAYLERLKDRFNLSAVQANLLQYDPETGISYDRIPNIIRADDYVVIEVPEAHLRDPLSDIRIGPSSLIVSSLSADKRQAIQANKSVVFRGSETGRLYFGGAVTIHNMLPEKQGFDGFIEKAKRAYENESGIKFPENRDVLVIEDLKPVANSRPDINTTHQSVKVPALFFDGLASPRLAHSGLDKPFTGMVLPVDYCPQKLEEGLPIRFREINAPFCAKLTADDGPETGHSYESASLDTVQRIRVGELLSKISAGEVSDAFAERCGFVSAFDMWEKINQAFLEQESPAPDQEEIYLLSFKQIDKESWAWFNPPETPEAAISYNADGTVPPSAYRPVQRPANDNNSEGSKYQRNKEGPQPN